MTSADLADALLAEAAAAMLRRKALLCARAALLTTSSPTAARRALADWDGPAEVKAAALAMLRQLAGEEA